MCTSLTEITIPNSVTSIEEGAFYGCCNLTSITSLIENPFKITGKKSDYRTFDLDVFNNVPLYVPKGTIDKYRSTEGWRDFANIVVMDGTTGIENSNCETITDNRYYNLNGQKVDGMSAQKGIYIKNGKKVLMR